MRKLISLLALIYHLLSFSLLLHNFLGNTPLSMDPPVKERRRGGGGAKLSRSCKGNTQKHQSHHQTPPWVVGNTIPVDPPKIIGNNDGIESNRPADILESSGPSLLIHSKHTQKKTKTKNNQIFYQKLKVTTRDDTINDLGIELDELKEDTNPLRLLEATSKV